MRPTKVQDKVGWILNAHPETRDSDVALAVTYWKTFHPELCHSGSLRLTDFHLLTKEISIVRARRRIQNDYGLFKASPWVRQKRDELAEDQREAAIGDIPWRPVSSVFMDDSGKNAESLIVASVWFLGDCSPVLEALAQVKGQRNLRGELHFSRLSKRNLDAYKAAVKCFREHAANASVKLISVRRPGLLTTESEAITELYHQLIVRGLEHDASTGRASLPRALQIWIDEEGAQLDRIRIARLSDTLGNAVHGRFMSKLELDHLTTVDSKRNGVLQIADLAAGSANRILNPQGGARNQKDEFAEYCLKVLGFDPSMPASGQEGDLATHIVLDFAAGR